MVFVLQREPWSTVWLPQTPNGWLWWIVKIWNPVMKPVVKQASLLVAKGCAIRLTIKNQRNFFDLPERVAASAPVRVPAPPLPERNYSGTPWQVSEWRSVLWVWWVWSDNWAWRHRPRCSPFQRTPPPAILPWERWDRRGYRIRKWTPSCFRRDPRTRTSRERRSRFLSFPLWSYRRPLRNRTWRSRRRSPCCSFLWSAQAVISTAPFPFGLFGMRTLSPEWSCLVRSSKKLSAARTVHCNGLRWKLGLLVRQNLVLRLCNIGLMTLLLAPVTMGWLVCGAVRRRRCMPKGKEPGATVTIDEDFTIIVFRVICGRRLFADCVI